jgi:tetratricopeptide (TPR) repeat protein
MNIKRIILLLLLFMCGINTTIVCQEQEDNYINYYRTCNEALKYKVKKNYTYAIELYQKAFNEKFPFPDDVKHLISCYLSQGDTTSALQTIRLLIKSGYKLDHNLPFLIENGERISSNNPLVLSGNFKLDSLLLLKEYDSLRSEFLINNNKEVNEYMKAITELEFIVGKLRTYASSKKEWEMLGDRSFRMKTHYLMNLLKSNLDLSRKHTDFWNDEYFIMALIHTVQDLCDDGPDSMLNDILNLLEKHMLKGNLHAQQYIIILDDVYYIKHKFKKSLYGTSIRLSGNNKYMVKIEDIKNVDNRRYNLFVPPLWIQYHNEEHLLPKDYIKFNYTTP